MEDNFKNTEYKNRNEESFETLKDSFSSNKTELNNKRRSSGESSYEEERTTMKYDHKEKVITSKTSKVVKYLKHVQELLKAEGD